MPSLRALIFDYGDVLTLPQPADAVAGMAELAAVPLAAFHPVYWSHRRSYDLDGDAGRYWRTVLEEAGSPLDEAGRRAAIPALLDLDVASWTRYRDETWAMVGAFRNGGGRTAVLSNAIPEVVARIRTRWPLERYFDVQVFSCEVALAKPDPAVYRLVLQRLQVEPGAALFVDDRADNLAAAQAAGLQTFHFVGDSTAALRAHLNQV